ncbi:MAG: hypothetical protein WBX78_00490, partial [Pseudolabrys sp.]
MKLRFPAADGGQPSLLRSNKIRHFLQSIFPTSRLGRPWEDPFGVNSAQAASVWITPHSAS